MLKSPPLTITIVECDSGPLVPVMFTWYEPGVWAVSWQELWTGEGGRLRGFGLQATKRPLLGIVAVDRVTVPPKLLREVTVTVADPELPDGNEMGLGAVRAKSTMWKMIVGLGCEAEPAVFVTVPVTVTV